MGSAEKIRILLVKRGNLSVAELARRVGTTPQNMHNKMSRDNFTESDLTEIAATLDCSCKIEFVMNDTGDTI